MLLRNTSASRLVWHLLHPRSPMTENLSPTQQEVLTTLRARLADSAAAILGGRQGMGKTRILRALQQGTRRTAFLTSRDFIEPDAADGRHPLAMEESVYAIVHEALERHDLV